MPEIDQSGTKELSIKDLATRIDRSYATALDYVHKGVIKGVRKGNGWVVPIEEVERFEKEGNHPEYNRARGFGYGAE